MSAPHTEPTTLEEAVAEHLDNPYWTLVQTYPDGGMSWHGAWQPEGFGLSRDAAGNLTVDDSRPGRDALVSKYAWAIPSPQSLAFVKEHAHGLPMVEVGAGTGYWGWLLMQMGVDFNAYDTNPPSEGENFWHSPRSKQRHVYTPEERAENRKRYEELRKMTDDLRALAKDATEVTMLPPTPEWREETETVVERPDGRPGHEWMPVFKGGPEVLALPENQTRVLFLCWPPYDKPMGVEVIRAYQGNTIILIGEGDGGCTGDDAMFAELAANWEEADACFKHVSWSGIHDYIQVYERRTA